jgi:hypothetical protein
MSRNVNAVRFIHVRSKSKRGRFALDYASWHAYLVGSTPLNVPTTVEPAEVVQLDYAAWYARLTGADRKAA